MKPSSGKTESLGCKIILTMRSVMVVEVLSDGKNPFRRVICEYDSTGDKYNDALRQAREKLRNLRN